MRLGPPSSLLIHDPAPRAELLQTRLAALAKFSRGRWERNDLPPDVAQAIKCIHAHLFDEELNVAFVCSASGLRNHNISCRFKHYIGTGMRQYIECERIAAAEYLLGLEGLSVLEIAWSIGYSYPETFERAFKRSKGCTPTQFRGGIVKTGR
jgi:AraC-like DNA-binding protein